MYRFILRVIISGFMALLCLTASGQPITRPSLYGIYGGGSVELGQKVTLEISFAGSGADQSYQWRKNGADLPGATTTTYILNAITAADAGTYSVTVTNASGASVASIDLAIKPLSAPAITLQPSAITAQVGQPVTFSLSATGSYPRTYQWRRDGNNLPSATNETYTIASVVLADAGVYSVVITNSQGAATSIGATLTVNPATPPVISTGTPSDATFAQGQGIALGVSFTSGSSPFTYQWLKNGVPILGATGMQLNFDSLALTDASTYSVVVTNIAGTATSRAATLTVTPAVPPVIGSPPQSQIVAVGQSANLSVYLSSGTSPVTYQWLKNGTPITGAIGYSYYINSAILADAGSYSVIATNVVGTVTSAAAVLTVNPAVAPTITVQPLSQVVNYFAAINLSVQVAGSGPFTYDWKKDGVTLASGPSNTYSVNNVTAASSGSYTVVVTNAAGSVTSNGAVISVNAPIAPTITLQPVSQTVDYYGYIRLSAQASGSNPLTFQWIKDGVTLASGSNGDFSINNATPANSGTYAVIVTNPAGTVTSVSVVVTVRPAAAPVITVQPSGRTVNYGDYFILGVTATGSAPLSFQWKKDGAVLSGPEFIDSNLRFSNATAANAGTYTVVVSNSAGSVTSNGAIVVVNPPAIPVIVTQPSGGTLDYYSNDTLTVAVSGSGPFTYQWKKDGVALTGATSSYLHLLNVTAANDGSYSVVVTSAAGSITSNSAVITVRAAIAPAITFQPAGRAYNYDDSVNLYVQVSGSGPLTFQWKKDGVALANTNSSNLLLSNLRPADSGTYTVVVTNSAGSVTSTGAVITVNPLVALTITLQPVGQTIAYRGDINLLVRVTGSSPVTYQWQKDGVALPGAAANYFNIFGAIPADSGTYSVIITNPGGSVTSSPAVITVTAVVAPRITRQPVSQQNPAGSTATFIAAADSTGAGPTTFQWFKDGIPLSGATSVTLSISNLKESDAGSYTFVATGIAGAVASDVATLTILPAAAPSFSNSVWPADVFVTLGDHISLSPFNISFGGPASYACQWLKDGVALPGATTYTLDLPAVRESDLGSYVLVASNGSGVAATPAARLRLPPTDTLPWLDARPLGGIAYFLAKSPSRIERYDLANERWLPVTLLSTTLVPTAFLPTEEGVYLAYGGILVRRSLDLATETPVATVANSIARLFTIGDLIYYDNVTVPSKFGGSTTGLATVHRSTLQAGPSFEGSFPALAISTQQLRGYAASGGTLLGGMQSCSIGADGTLTPNPATLSYGYVVAGGTRAFLLPGETCVANNGGSVYRTSDLSYTGSFGDAFDDIIFLSDGTSVLLRNCTLTSASSANFVETGRFTLPFVGVRAFTFNDNVFVFGAAAATGGSFQATKVAASSVVPATPQPINTPTDEPFSLDDVYFNDGVVGILSRSKQAIFRWSAMSRSYLSAVPLRSSPRGSTQRPGAARALLAYSGGVITEVPIGAGVATERPIASLGNTVRKLTDLGDMIMVNVLMLGAGDGDFRMVLNSQGLCAYLGGWGFLIDGLTWQPDSRRLYSGGGSTRSRLAGIVYETVPSSGILPGFSAIDNNSNPDLTPPLHFNREGTMAVSANGRVVNADLVQVGMLANDILDAAWLPAGLFTLRTPDGQTQIQAWSRANYAPIGTLSLRGLPLRIFPLSDTQLVVVASAQGYLSFTIINSDLTISTDPSHPVILATQPQSQSVAQSGSVTLSLSQSSTTIPATYAWSRNGTPILSAAGPNLKLDNVQPLNAGLYTGVVTTSFNSATSDVAIVGLSTANKVIGTGTELSPVNITHPNGNTFDQVLLTGTAESITADAGQVTRTSYIDLNNDIVQVEFSGAGTLSLVLDNPTAPATPVNYNQPSVTYMKGHAGIVVASANETTNLSIFSVGRVTAFDPTGGFNFLLPISPTNNPANNGSSLFSGHAATSYDGIADVAFIAISSTNGKFGGLRASNASCFATKGYTGIYAPGVAFTGPVFIGDINAFDTAAPVFIVGSSPDTRITGGDLLQTNNQPVKVAGLTQLKFLDGSTSNGTTLPAQSNKARLEQNGVDVTAQIVVNPTP